MQYLNSIADCILQFYQFLILQIEIFLEIFYFFSSQFINFTRGVLNQNVRLFGQRKNTVFIKIS